MLPDRLGMESEKSICAVFSGEAEKRKLAAGMVQRPGWDIVDLVFDGDPKIAGDFVKPEVFAGKIADDQSNDDDFGDEEWKEERERSLEEKLPFWVVCVAETTQTREWMNE